MGEQVEERQHPLNAWWAGSTLLSALPLSPPPFDLVEKVLIMILPLLHREWNRGLDVKCLANCVLKRDGLSGPSIYCQNNEYRSMNRSYSFNGLSNICGALILCKIMPEILFRNTEKCKTCPAFGGADSLGRGVTTPKRESLGPWGVERCVLIEKIIGQW